MLAIFLLAALCLESGFSVPTQFQVPDNAKELYEDFKTRHAKNYANHDNEYRFTVFKNNLIRMQEMKALDTGTAEYGVTKFSDLTAEEFRGKFLTKVSEEIEGSDMIMMEPVQRDIIPNEFDWRNEGAVTPVEDQKGCTSGWAFAAIGSIEGQWFRKTKELVTFSKQQLLDCDEYDEGCKGGSALRAYEAIRMMGGVVREEDYPYTASSDKCQVDHTEFLGFVNATVRIGENENEIKAQIYKYGPLSMVLNKEYLQFYKHGIMHPPRDLCSPDQTDHSVLAVGFGIEKDRLPFYIIKNSWGSSWGESGYFRIYRGDESCGINTLVTAPVVE